MVVLNLLFDHTFIVAIVYDIIIIKKDCDI